MFLNLLNFNYKKDCKEFNQFFIKKSLAIYMHKIYNWEKRCVFVSL